MSVAHHHVDVGRGRIANNINSNAYQVGIVRLHSIKSDGNLEHGGVFCATVFQILRCDM